MGDTTENSTDHFFKWLDAIAKTPIGLIGKSKGYHIWHSGGGCHHFRKTHENGCYVLVCDDSEIPETDRGKWLVGLYDAEDAEVNFIDFEGSLEEALAASDKLLDES